MKRKIMRLSVAAFDLCIALMDREEICELVSNAEYAYGKLGRYFVFHCDNSSFAVIMLCLSFSFDGT